jgi:D-alanyl-D-alanine carboxypeptidase/D-alanyl-D-alanine-endopeptidase (penicillin-binding protein 4)
LSVPGRTRRQQALYAVLALLTAGTLATGVSALATHRTGLLAGGLGRTGPTPVLPALVAPTPVLAGLAAPPAAGRSASAAAVARVLAGPLSDHRLGPRVSALVVDLATGTVLDDRGGSRLATPASTAKLGTACAVLASYPSDHRFTTTVVAGAHPGEVVLVGGGDPTLSAAAPGQPTDYPGAARLTDLAAAVRRAGVRVSTVVVDSSRFTGPRLGPGWDPRDVAGGYIAPITALMTDAAQRPGQLARADQPDLAAGTELAAAVGAPAAKVVRGTAPAGARLLGQVRSAPLARIVEQTLLASDNVLAETLARQVALAVGQPASFAGAAQAVRGVLGRLGVDVSGDRLLDGSGLSPQDRLTARLLVDLLRAAAAAGHPELHPVFAALPVAGYDGTLDTRYRSGVATAGAGEVRAKTGTLTGVSALAGLVQTRAGQLLAFAFLADRAPGVRAAEAALDIAASTLARCGC